MALVARGGRLAAGEPLRSHALAPWVLDVEDEVPKNGVHPLPQGAFGNGADGLDQAPFRRAQFRMDGVLDMGASYAVVPESIGGPGPPAAPLSRNL